MIAEAFPSLADSRFTESNCAGAIIYQHTDFNGRSTAVGPKCRFRDSISDLNVELPTTDPPNRLFTESLDLNDRVSSVDVPNGSVLVLWSQQGFKGRIVVLGYGKHRSLQGYNMNDDAGSVALYATESVPFVDRFYRRIGEPHVYWIGKDFSCRVSDPSQMERFGGMRKVMLVSDNVALPGAQVDRTCSG
jgi:hypothetical protein